MKFTPPGSPLVLLPAVAALSVCLAACGGTSPDRGPAVPADAHYTATSMTSSGGQAELLLRPKGRVSGLVLFEHGYGGTEDQILDPSLTPMRDALLSSGYAIASSASHGNNYGDPASVADQAQLLSDAEKRLPTSPEGRQLPVSLLAASMGGLDALEVASDHSLPGLQAVVLLSPVCDQLEFLSSSFGPLLRSSFGGGQGPDLVASIAPYDPALRRPSSYAGYRYWFWHSPTDSTVPVTQSEGMVALLQRAHVQVRFSPLDGGHLDLAKLQPEAVVKFIQTGARG